MIPIKQIIQTLLCICDPFAAFFTQFDTRLYENNTDEVDINKYNSDDNNGEIKIDNDENKIDVNKNIETPNEKNNI